MPDKLTERVKEIRERDEAILLFIEERRIRGATCHEIAEGMGLTPRTVGRSLARVKDKLSHLRNERSGQKVFTLKIGNYSCASCGFGMQTPCEHWTAHLEERINELETTVERLRAERRWIPVSERLPERNGRYLVITKWGDMRVEIFNREDGDGWYGMTCPHWQPLPAPPVAEAAMGEGTEEPVPLVDREARR